MPRKKRSKETTVLEELRAMAHKPPKRANRLIMRHLKCEESLMLSHAVTQAAKEPYRRASPRLELPSGFLPPLV